MPSMNRPLRKLSVAERPNAKEALEILASAELLFSAAEIDFAIDQLAVQITLEFAESNPVIVCVMTGGLSFTADLIKRLRFPLTLDYLHATRYREALSGEQLKWHVLPHTNMKDKTVIILDDVLDYGITLAEVVKQPVFDEAKRVVIAVMLDKKLDRAKPIQADYAALTAGDRYAFGRGMDCRAYWRNLPDIYALPEQ